MSRDLAEDAANVYRTFFLSMHICRDYVATDRGDAGKYWARIWRARDQGWLVTRQWRALVE